MTASAVDASSEINEAIARVSEISTAIASVVEQQTTATGEIAQNVEEAANGATDVTQSVVSIQTATAGTKEISDRVVDAAGSLRAQEAHLQKLRDEMNEFLATATKVG